MAASPEPCPGWGDRRGACSAPARRAPDDDLAYCRACRRARRRSIAILVRRVTDFNLPLAVGRRLLRETLGW